MAQVLLAGTYDPTFSRNRRLRTLLEVGGHDVRSCQVDLWGGDRVAIPDQPKVALALRAVRAYLRLGWRLLRAPRPDLVLVGYPGWFDVVVLGPLVRLRRLPLLFDPFISLFDTVIEDRRLRSEGSRLARVCRWADRRSLRTATRSIADTPTHAEHYAELAGIDRERVGVVWVGADDDVFRPQPSAPAGRRVLFYGSLIALHGVETIVEAAAQLDGTGTTFRIIGTGQEQRALDEQIARLQPSNVEVVPPVPLADLPQEIAAASVCLGIFGTSQKAARVVPHKVFECAAVGRPIITADTPAAREAFGGAVVLVPAGDPTALASAVEELLADQAKRDALATAAQERYRERYSTTPLAAALDEQVRRAMGNSARVGTGGGDGRR
jgi:glycosyltransferase involved in cell wall biosynthesis